MMGGYKKVDQEAQGGNKAVTADTDRGPAYARHIPPFPLVTIHTATLLPAVLYGYKEVVSGRGHMDADLRAFYFHLPMDVEDYNSRPDLSDIQEIWIAFDYPPGL